MAFYFGKIILMKKIKGIFKKIGLGILKVLGISSLVSCLGDIEHFISPENIAVCYYGVGPNYNYVEGTVYGDIDGDGTEEPVPGIQYTVTSSTQNQTIIEYSRQTDEDGYFFNDIYSDGEDEILTLTFEDIDGEENGKFKTQSVSFPANQSFSDQEIHLEADND